MSAAPPVACDRCGHLIGKRREHWLLRDGSVWCCRCALRHDDDQLVYGSATRAAVARIRKTNPGTATTKEDPA